MYNHDIAINVTCYRIIEDVGVKLDLKDIRMPELHPVTVDLLVVIDFVCRTVNCNNSDPTEICIPVISLPIS